MFRTKAIAFFATIACVCSVQQGSAGNSEFIAARPTLMVLPLAAIVPAAIAASATAEATVFDYESPARQIIFPGLEEQVLEGTLKLRVPVPAVKPTRSAFRVNRELKSAARPRVVAQVIRAKAEPRRVASVSVVRFSGTLQPIIGAFR